MNTAQEQKFAACYETLRDTIQLNYPLALNIFRCLHDFLVESLDSEVQIDSAVELPPNANFGSSVKIKGKFSFVVGVLSEKKTFHNIAERYEHFHTESLAEDFDAVSELLNVVTGILIVKVATVFGTEEDLEPPRFGQTEKTFGVIKILVNVGTFYLYIGKDEIL